MLSLGLLTIGCSSPPPSAPAPQPCEACHAEQVEAWASSHHALAERLVGPEDGWAEALGAERVIGVHPLQQALVPATEGRLQAHSTAWDVEKRETFPLHTDGREQGEWGHWTGRGLTWNSRCAACHNTNVVKGLENDTYQTRAEVGVTCAACHGDASLHAAGAEPPVNLEMEATCAVCHLRRAELGLPLLPGVALLDQVLPTLIDDPVFRADGLGLDEVFEFSNFASSKMHGAGVRCGDCHDPHSGGLRAQGDALCSRCHEAIPTKHPIHVPAVACVDCHMPELTLMERHPRRDHGFTSPRKGLQPDACAGCHGDHPATAPVDPQDRAFQRLRDHGELNELDLKPTNRWRRAAILRQIGGRPQTEAAVLEALQSADPLLRMAAADTWQSPKGPSVLRPLLTDPVRAVRVAAQRNWLASGGRWTDASDYRLYLDHNADDPATRAERGMVRLRNGDGAGLDDLIWAAQHDPTSPTLAAWLSIGFSRMGKPRDAVNVLLTAEAEHPHDPEILWNLALGLAGMKRDAEAIERLLRLVQLEPEHGRAWRNLALLHKRSGDPAFPQTLRRAVEVNPDDRELASWAASLNPGPSLPTEGR